MHARQSVVSSTCSSRHCLRPLKAGAPRLALRVQAAVAEKAPDVERASELLVPLKQACLKTGSVPPSVLLKNVLALESLKLKPVNDEWLKQLTTGNWRLVYTCGSKDVIAFQKGRTAKTGQFVPFNAAQSFTEHDLQFENGVFLGPLGHLTFKGPFEMQGKIARFDVDTMFIGIGPWRTGIPLKKPQEIPKTMNKAKKGLPFFIYIYVDDQIAIARGRTGGLAFWAKCDAEWSAKAGVLQAYK